MDTLKVSVKRIECGDAFEASFAESAC